MSRPRKAPLTDRRAPTAVIASVSEAIQRPPRQASGRPAKNPPVVGRVGCVLDRHVASLLAKTEPLTLGVKRVAIGAVTG